jgi:hypothetical protein
VSIRGAGAAADELAAGTTSSSRGSRLLAFRRADQSRMSSLSNNSECLNMSTSTDELLEQTMQVARTWRYGTKTCRRRDASTGASVASAVEVDWQLSNHVASDVWDFESHRATWLSLPPKLLASAYFEQR